MRERVSYKMIKEYIEAKYGFKVHTAYIAEVKRDLGLHIGKMQLNLYWLFNDAADDFNDDYNLSSRDEFIINKAEWIRTDISIQPANTLSNGKCFFTAGYPVRNDENVYGIITAGHITGIKKDMRIFADENEIGSVYDYEFSDNMDAAFIELDSSVKCSNVISVPPNPVITGIAPEFICGAYVELYSGRDGCAHTGRVAYPRFDFMNFKNIAVFTYSSESGDSGGSVLLPMNGKKSVLAGIHLGTFFMGGKVYSYGRTAKEINERFFLKLAIN